MSLPCRIFQTPPGQHFFFGYYDKSPLDATNRRLLAQRAAFVSRMVKADDVLELGVFDWREHPVFVPLAETRAWNWQQGCMLQWLGPDHHDRLLYNDRQGGQFVSVILDVESGARTALPMAVYAVDRQGTLALCIDNERHYWFRPGYNYQGVVNPAKQAPLDPGDGIWLLDLKRGDVRQVVNIMTLLETSHLSSMDGASHCLEHLMFSPSGGRFCFLHRWKIPDGGVYSRLYTADADGSVIRLVADSGRINHFSWLDDHRIVAYGGISTGFTRLRRYRGVVRYLVRPLLPLYHAVVPPKSSLRKRLTGDGYMILEDPEGGPLRLAPDVLCEDGHPSRSPAQPNLLLSDTYEGAGHVREVFLLDMGSGAKIWSEKLRSIPELDSTGMRCDLHPKWSFDGAYFAVDTMNDGCRGIYLYAMGAGRQAPVSAIVCSTGDPWRGGGTLG